MVCWITFPDETMMWSWWNNDIVDDLQSDDGPVEGERERAPWLVDEDLRSELVNQWGLKLDNLGFL